MTFPRTIGNFTILRKDQFLGPVSGTQRDVDNLILQRSEL